MPELKRLHAAHAPAVLAFELANRAYFAASVSDRGDDFFAQFTDRYNALLAEQEASICAFHVLAAARHGLRTLRAATARQNAASQQVLTKAGFVPVGPADPAHLGGKPGTWYQRDLVIRPHGAMVPGDRRCGRAEATADRRCVKTNDLAVAVGHNVDPAWRQEAFEGLMRRIAGRFARVEPRRRVKDFVLGLLSDLPRKNCWTIAEWAGEAGSDGMQHWIGRATWDAGGRRG
ncbi:hypothetical protein GCM10010211_77760 [Streptomyces albospinus]|uniref:Uncharacterized protein n=1 Tax=Streptomyces albospinus TaxID=285515 RepID=A0ABQ2VQX0_9ACTN|nr:hypothetical protein GCM10010211_77760 [Streptomyces albospinus]